MKHYRLARNLAAIALLAVLGVLFAPGSVAFAQEAEAVVAEAPTSENDVQIVKYVSAAAAMGLSALAAGYAQAKIGTAAAGTLAEKPEVATMLIVLQALPEIIVLLGFVTALIIAG